MRRWSALALTVLTAGVSLSLAPAALPAKATSVVGLAAGGPRVGLVVDYGGGKYEARCVGVPQSGSSGLDVIVASGIDYAFGSTGNQAVCRLGGVGSPSDDCFAKMPYFWGYWRSTSGGDWTWGEKGAGRVVARDGDIEGWAWGTGMGPDSHPKPHKVSIAEACGTSDPAVRTATPRPLAVGSGAASAAGASSPSPQPSPVTSPSDIRLDEMAASPSPSLSSPAAAIRHLAKFSSLTWATYGALVAGLIAAALLINRRRVR